MKENTKFKFKGNQRICRFRLNDCTNIHVAEQKITNQQKDMVDANKRMLGVLNGNSENSADFNRKFQKYWRPNSSL